MDYTIILALMGGLGLFLYGMKLMSDGLEKAAGAKLRRILEIFTTNRLTGMLVGIFFTAVIQSSSAATVMVTSSFKNTDYTVDGGKTIFHFVEVILSDGI